MEVNWNRRGSWKRRDCRASVNHAASRRREGPTPRPSRKRCGAPRGMTQLVSRETVARCSTRMVGIQPDAAAGDEAVRTYGDPGARAGPRRSERRVSGAARNASNPGAHGSRESGTPEHLCPPPRHIERRRGVAPRRDPERVSSVATLSHSAPPDDEDRGRARSYGRHSDDGLPLPVLVARSPPRNHPSCTWGGPDAHGRARRQTGASDTEAAQRSMRPRAGGEIRRLRSGMSRMSR